MIASPVLNSCNIKFSGGATPEVLVAGQQATNNAFFKWREAIDKQAPPNRIEELRVGFRIAAEDQHKAIDPNHETSYTRRQTHKLHERSHSPGVRPGGRLKNFQALEFHIPVQDRPRLFHTTNGDIKALINANRQTSKALTPLCKSNPGNDKFFNNCTNQLKETFKYLAAKVKVKSGEPIESLPLLIESKAKPSPSPFTEASSSKSAPGPNVSKKRKDRSPSLPPEPAVYSSTTTLPEERSKVTFSFKKARRPND